MLPPTSPLIIQCCEPLPLNSCTIVATLMLSIEPFGRPTATVSGNVANTGMGHRPESTSAIRAILALPPSLEFSSIQCFILIIGKIIIFPAFLLLCVTKNYPVCYDFLYISLLLSLLANGTFTLPFPSRCRPFNNVHQRDQHRHFDQWTYSGRQCFLAVRAESSHCNCNSQLKIVACRCEALCRS